MKGDKSKKRKLEEKMLLKQIRSQQESKKAQFVNVSEEEAIAEKKIIEEQGLKIGDASIDFDEKLKIKEGFEMAEKLIELRSAEALIDFKGDQVRLIGENIDSYDKRLIEHYNGVMKPKKMLLVELADARFKYNILAMQYNKLVDKFEKVYKIDKENILRLANGDFDYKYWEEEGSVKSEEDERKVEED